MAASFWAEPGAADKIIKQAAVNQQPEQGCGIINIKFPLPRSRLRQDLPKHYGSDLSFCGFVATKWMSEQEYVSCDGRDSVDT
jgi:hypothetical protein